MFHYVYTYAGPGVLLISKARSSLCVNKCNVWWRVFTLIEFISKMFLIDCKALAFLHHMWRRRAHRKTLGGYSTKLCHGDTVDLRGNFGMQHSKIWPTDGAKINDLYPFGDYSTKWRGDTMDLRDSSQNARFEDFFQRRKNRCLVFYFL